MDAHYHLAEFASLLADPTRAKIVVSLMGGASLSATELATQADVSPSTASEHLSRLLAGEILALDRQGRHRYFRIANSRVSDALERIIAFTSKEARKRPITDASLRLARARTCYDHLAGRLGVQLTQALVTQRLLMDRHGHYELSHAGQTTLAKFGIRLPEHPKAAIIGKKCLDWTERRPHLGGRLGADITNELLRLKWVQRISGERALRITQNGRFQLGALMKTHSEFP